MDPERMTNAFPKPNSLAFTLLRGLFGRDPFSYQLPSMA